MSWGTSGPSTTSLLSAKCLFSVIYATTHVRCIGTWVATLLGNWYVYSHTQTPLRWVGSGYKTQETLVEEQFPFQLLTINVTCRDLLP